MRIRHAGLWLSIASALLVVWFVWSDRGRVSPGPLSAAHEREPELADGGCELCHGGGATAMADACTSCHSAIGDQVREKRGFHGTLARDAGDVASCGRCHSEHHGEEFALTSAASFALAGVPDRATYDHARLHFGLSGAHAQLACRECHAHADDLELAKGTQRFTGLTQACASCHDDAHGGALPDCAACHGQEHPFERVANFVHTATFPLSGSHAGPACLDCHPKNSPHAVEVLAATQTIASASSATPRACGDCHASPHSAGLLAEITRERGIASTAACVECHTASDASFAGDAAVMTAHAHAATGFALDPPHAGLACAACHAQTKALPVRTPDSTAFARFAAAHPGRKAEDCAACHADPHNGQFDEGAFAGKGCLACHAPHDFRPPIFEIAQHAATAFPLTGSHAAVACGECHRDVPREARTDREPDLVRMFRGTSSACASCHADAHGGFFAETWQRRSVPASEGCGHCHTTATFEDGAAERFDHAAWTRMPLVGAHARAKCESCHPRTREPDNTERTFGRAVAHAAESSTNCGACHADAHAGFFAARAGPSGVPPTASGAADAQAAACSACHTQESFDVLVAPFDHARWTGFALDGAHARAACETCHAPAAKADATGRRFGRARVAAQAAGNDCRACHTDAHQGAFDRAGLPASVDGRAGCLRCHTSERFDDIREPGFDHAHWTGFRLEGAHAELDCASCHAPATAADAVDARFAKAAGTACAACHADPHVGQFAQAGRTDCARCHTSDASFRQTSFDHQRDARFALDATHARLACSACHLPQTLPGGGTAVRYKPLGTVCGDCHDPRDAALRNVGAKGTGGAPAASARDAALRAWMAQEDGG